MDKVISSLLNEVVITFPIQPPKSQARPYASYESQTYDEAKSFEGYLTKTNIRYEVSVISDSVAESKELYIELRNKIKSVERTTQGGIYIERVTLDNNAPEFWENEIKAYRKILNFEISYQGGTHGS